MKKLSQQQIETVTGGIYLSGIKNTNFTTIGLTSACQNAFRVESDQYSGHWFSNNQFKNALKSCSADDVTSIIDRIFPTYSYGSYR